MKDCDGCFLDTKKERFCPTSRGGHIAWLIQYILEESFSTKHLQAITHIVGLFNDSIESEREVFEFARKLYERHVGPLPESEPEAQQEPCPACVKGDKSYGENHAEDCEHHVPF